jgi:hypothetical protein
MDVIELDSKRLELQKQLAEIDERIVLQKAIDKLKVYDLHNNLLINVKVFEHSTTSFNKGGTIVFTLNGEQVKIDFTYDEFDRLGDLIPQVIAQRMVQEITKLTKQ